MKRIVYMGTPDYAKVILESLHLDKRFEVIAVYTQPDRPVGRKRVMTPPDVKVYASDAKLQVYQPENINEPQEIERLQSLKPDVVIVAAYGQFVSQAILDIAPCINLHASLLPHYRGASPIQETVLNGDHYAGVTAMRMELGMDSGDILGFSYFPTSQCARSECLYKHLAFTAANLTKDVLVRFNTLKPLPQAAVDASYVKKRTKVESIVHFENALQIDRKFRAFDPWPGVQLSNGLKLKELSLESLSGSYREGEILSIDDEGAVIGCLEGSIRLKSVQPPSKKAMDITSYLNGKRLECGAVLV